MHTVFVRIARKDADLHPTIHGCGMTAIEPYALAESFSNHEGWGHENVYDLFPNGKQYRGECSGICLRAIFKNAPHGDHAIKSPETIENPKLKNFCLKLIELFEKHEMLEVHFC